MDYEHQPLNHLCFRLARRVIVPLPFPIEMLNQYGALKKAFFYPGIKEQVYLADFVPVEGFRQFAGLPDDQLLVVMRPPATWTAYHRFENDIFDQALMHLANQQDAFVLFLPRLPSQAERLQRLAAES